MDPSFDRQTRPSPRRRMWLLVAVAAALALGAAYSLHASRDARLLRTFANAVVADPVLVGHADAVARPVLSRQCASCHGADLHGDPSRGTPNVVDADWLHGDGTVAQIEQTITYGIRSGLSKSRNLADMPGFAKPVPYARYKIPPLKPGQIDDVIAYLDQIGGKTADPAAVARGFTVFRGPGGCYDCHGEDGSGDGSIGAPNLTDAVWLYGGGTHAELFDIIGLGRAGACPAWGRSLSRLTIRALAVTLYSRSHPASSKPAKAPA